MWCGGEHFLHSPLLYKASHIRPPHFIVEFEVTPRFERNLLLAAAWCMLKGSVTGYFPSPCWGSVLHDLEITTFRWHFELEKCSMSHFVSLGSLHHVWPGDD